MPSKEVRDATGEGPERKSVSAKAKSPSELLTEKRQELDSAGRRYSEAKAKRDHVGMADSLRVIEVLGLLIRELEAEVAAVAEQDALQKAQQRILGISRAVGSILSETVEDRERVLEAARAYAEAVNRLNDRFAKYQSLVAEDAALRDRFGVTGAKIPRVVSPNETASVIAASRVVEAVTYATDRISRPQTEKDEHGVRERRTYGEVAGSPAYAIIVAAGAKPWRPLSEREQESIAALGREKEAWASLSEERAVEANIAHALGNAGVPGGDVHRG